MRSLHELGCVGSILDACDDANVRNSNNVLVADLVVIRSFAQRPRPVRLSPSSSECRESTLVLDRTPAKIMGEEEEDERRSPALIGAIDQGTSSSRFLVFDARTCELVTSAQKELSHHYPKEGWVEMDAAAILESTLYCMEQACQQLEKMNYSVSDIKAVGITNQRETTVCWNRQTGRPLYNALVWSDMRTQKLAEDYKRRLSEGDKRRYQRICGLPIHPYFSALKMRWLLDNVSEVRKCADQGLLCMGTVDTWLLWNLTGKFVTDVTNASRTMLMGLQTLQWDRRLLQLFDIERKFLADIRSSAEIYGHIRTGRLARVPVAGCLGDQQAALVGEGCLQPGTAKSTYGTGCFMLCNTGRRAIQSRNGLLTTVAYQLGPNQQPQYALEGSVAVAGVVVRWLRDQLQVIENSADVEKLAASVADTGDVYFVPAFSGLYAPYWCPEARGVICGLTQYSTKAHLARAALEATCFQTCEIVDAMREDASLSLHELKVDGGMIKNNLLLQMLADLLGVQVIRRHMLETSSLGAAAAAGLAVGVWDQRVLTENHDGDTVTPKIDAEERRRRYKRWKKAVKRSMNWAVDDDDDYDRSYNSFWTKAAIGGTLILLTTTFIWKKLL